jgi:hypothetical protein
MGVEWNANTVVGCEVPRDKLYKTSVVSGCRHANAPGAKFCSQCGAKAWIEQEEPIDRYDRDRGKLGTLSVCGTTDGERMFVGIVSESCDQGRSQAKKMPIYLDAEVIVRQQLDPLGLWDPTTFGIWCVMRHAVQLLIAVDRPRCWTTGRKLPIDDAALVELRT